MFTILIAQDEKKIKDMIAHLLREEGYSMSDDSQKRGMLYKAVLEKIEKQLIEQILERTEGNQIKAAKFLGINRNTIRAKIKKLGIDVNRWKV